MNGGSHGSGDLYSHVRTDPAAWKAWSKQQNNHQVIHNYFFKRYGLSIALILFWQGIRALARSVSCLDKVSRSTEPEGGGTEQSCGQSGSYHERVI